MMTYLVLLRNSFLAIHFLAAVVWIGGMFYTLVVLRPALNVLDATPRLQLHMLTLKKFFFVVWHAMPGAASPPCRCPSTSCRAWPGSWR